MISTSKLKRKIKSLEEDNKDPHKRGHEFEQWILNLFSHFDIMTRRRYDLPHEEFDGAIEYKGKHIIIEAKWHNKPITLKDILYFSNKISNKFVNTIGIIISMSGYPQNIHESLNTQLKEKNIILIDKQDIFDVLDHKLSIHLLIDEKIRAASYDGNFYLRSTEILQNIVRSNTIDHLDIACEILELQLSKLQSKYSKKLYVNRKLENVLLNKLTNLRSINPKKPIFALVDRAGAGKTNILCSIAERLASKNVVLFLTGNVQINNRNDLLEHFNSYLKISFENRHIPFTPSAFWDSLKYRAANEQIRLLIIIDAINENPNVQGMATELELLASTYLYDKWATIIISCRDVYWEYFESNAYLMSLLNFVFKDEIYQFDENEFKKALNKYLKFYSIDVSLVDDAYEKCKHPLLLRFFCEAYRGSCLNTVNNIRLLDLFDVYCERKIRSIASKVPFYRHQNMEVLNFIYKIAKFMYNTNNKFIDLLNIAPIFYGQYYIYNHENIHHIESLYSRILDEDIIFEEIRSFTITSPHIKTHSEERILFTFVYEEFMEYAIASSIEKEMRNLKDSEVILQIEKLFDKQKRFINIFGIMLFLGSILERSRGLSIWRKLYEKGHEWRAILLEVIFKCPEEMINFEFVNLISQICESVSSKQYEDYDNYIEFPPEKIIKILGHRKFLKYNEEVVKTIERFLSYPNSHIQKLAVEQLESIHTEKSLQIILENFSHIVDTNPDLKMFLVRTILKSKNKCIIDQFISFIHDFPDQEILQFLTKNKNFVQKQLNLSKKKYDRMMTMLQI